MDQYIDIHCHILPGIDDGARDLEESVAMARRYVEAGFEAVVATPHFIPGTAWAADTAIIAAKIEVLQRRLEAEGVALTIHAGMEIAYHPHLPDRLQQGILLPLAGGGHYLLEPSFHGSQENMLHCVKKLLDTGRKVILAHAERIKSFQHNIDPLVRLAGQGLEIQVNTGSLLDAFDAPCKETALALLAADSVHYLASDAHGPTRRPPPTKQDRQQLEKLIGPEALSRLWGANPARLLVTPSDLIQQPLLDTVL